MSSALHKIEVSPVPRVALRCAEAAEALGISDRTLQTWTKAGTIPHVRRGAVVLYPVDALRAWLEAEAAKQAETANCKTADDHAAG